MPYRTTWMNPELYYASRRVRVYHTYLDNDFERGPMPHWFTLRRQCEPDRTRCELECCPHVFDVRELSTWRQPVLGDESNPTTRIRFRQSERRAVRAAIEKAIATGELTKDGLRSRR